MGKIWVLDTDTKGTGAHVVPLEKVLEHPAPRTRRRLRRRSSRPKPSPPPEPRQPSRFKVVDVISGRVLGEGIEARATVDLLGQVRSVVDVRTYVWEPESERWRLLPHRDHKLLWGLRGG